MSLQNLQAEFIELMFSKDEQNEMFTPQENIIIYHNNMKSHLTQAMSHVYPLLTKLLGHDFFLQIVHEYIEQYPSRSSNLNDYGEYFSDFLSEYPSLENLNYLFEVSQFEWQCHLLQSACDHPGLDIKKLDNISSDDYQHLHFNLHPASFLKKFSCPLLRIIDLCKGDLDEEINMREGGVNLLLFRRDMEIIISYLSLAEFNFLSAINDGCNLEKSLEITLQIDPEFELEKLLLLWVQKKILVDFYIG